LSFELRVVFFFGLGYSSVVEYLPSMCEALYSIPATKKEKPRNKKKKCWESGSSVAVPA
jgi:hypothetical protein